MKNFLFEDLPHAYRANQGTIEEFAERMQRGEPDLSAIGREVLSIVRSSFAVATDEEIHRFSSKGRGADFTAVQLYSDRYHDDMLRLHVYPRETHDGEFHDHSRRVISTVAVGEIVNYTAKSEICSRDESELDIWDCTIIDGACTPQINTELGARLSPDGSEIVRRDDTYEVPTGVYHKITVEEGTATLCWFAKSGMPEDPKEARIIKARNAAPEPVRELVRSDLLDVRDLLGR